MRSTAAQVLKLRKRVKSVKECSAGWVTDSCALGKAVRLRATPRLTGSGASESRRMERQRGAACRRLHNRTRWS